MELQHTSTALVHTCQSRALPIASRPARRQSRLIPSASSNGAALPSGPMKKMPRWDIMWEKLYQNEKLKIVSAAEASELDKEGWQLVDVRPKNRFDESHAVGAIHVPLYERTSFAKFNALSWLKAGMLMSQGVDPVELNPDFVEQLAAKAGNKGVVLMCEIGGTLTPTTSFSTGKVSRSLMATYNALESGKFPGGVAHVKGGCFGWFKAGLPMEGEGEYDSSGVGRTPSVVEEEIFSYGRPTESLNIEP